MARKSSMQDFLDNFNAAYGMTKKVTQDMELADIANAKPEQVQAFTEDQAQALGQAAAANPEGVAYDAAKQSYTVTPKADVSAKGDSVPVDPKTFAMQGMTDFMGKRTPGVMDDAAVTNERQRAMAGVMMKSDPVQGMRMMRDVTQGERDDKRFGFETARNEREQRLAKEQDDDKALTKQLDSDVGSWFEQRLAGPDGTKRAATVDDHLAASQYKASKLMAAGKTDAAGKAMQDFSSQSLIKIQLETAQRNEALGKTASALAAGDLGAVKDFYNQYIPDGAHVTDVQRGPKGEIVIQRESADGLAMPPTTMKDTGQLLSALSTFKDPMALYTWSQNEFKNNLAINADKRADRADIRAGNADARAASSAATTKTDALAKAAAGVALYKETNPNATPAQLEAVRTGIMAAAPKLDANAPAEVKLANAYKAAGLAKTDADALKMATQSKGDSPEKVRASIYEKALTAKFGNAKEAKAATEEAMAYLYPQAGRSASGPVTPLQNVTSADITATAKKHGITEDEVKKRLGIQ